MQIKSVFLLIFCLVFSSVGCIKRNQYGLDFDQLSNAISEGWLESSLESFPRSRFLSDQDVENLHFAGSHHGFDPNYRMLNFRPLENTTKNPESQHPEHVKGLRTDAQYIQIPATGDTIGSKALVDFFLQELEKPENRFLEIQNRIQNQRAEILEQHSRPRTIVSGLGPAGLLAVLEAYFGGASVIGIEQRSQYTRPQVLRLSPDTMNRIRFFVGEPLWKDLYDAGIFSRSPNWVQNKFDFNNFYLYGILTQSAKDLIWNSFSNQEQALYESYLQKNLELETVEIVRINHLETLLAATIEKLSKSDPKHLRIYYGGTLKLSQSSQLELAMHDGDRTSVYPLTGDVVAVTEGSAGRLSDRLGVRSKTLSHPLYGATVALRLPVGFDIGLRPIENREGTASVKGIAKIDPEKLSSSIEGFSWTMIDELQLCQQLNDVLSETLSTTHSSYTENEILIPCLPSGDLDQPWVKRNGGEVFFLPRTRYFFTGGIAYLGADLTSQQYELFHQKAAAPGLKKFMLVLAKKHMPKEYIEGQANSGMIASAAMMDDSSLADEGRVVTVTEESHSMSLFPIEIKKRDQLFTLKQIQKRPVRFVFLGDAYATTHFFTGSGAVNGLRSAMYFGEAIGNGGSYYNWADAEKKISQATLAMHSRVMRGEGNAPLDGPFNESLE